MRCTKEVEAQGREFLRREEQCGELEADVQGLFRSEWADDGEDRLCKEWEHLSDDQEGLWQEHGDVDLDPVVLAVFLRRR